MERLIKKKAQINVDLTNNKIADRITKVSKNSQQNNLETFLNDNDKEIPKERYIFLEQRQKLIDDLSLI